MHVVVALFRRDWFVAAAMRAMREPPSVGARSIIARATALDNMRRCVVGVCARASRVCVCVTTLGPLFWILDFGLWILDLDLDCDRDSRAGWRPTSSARGKETRYTPTRGVLLRVRCAHRGDDDVERDDEG